jgi:hypothetical protein
MHLDKLVFKISLRHYGDLTALRDQYTLRRWITRGHGMVQKNAGYLCK